MTSIYSMPIFSCGYIQEDKKLAWSCTTSVTRRMTGAGSLSLPAWIYVVDKPISQLHHLVLGAKFPPTQSFLWDMHGYFALSKLWRRLLLPA